MDHIGKYEIKRKLGDGATSAVYLAWDPFAQRDVFLGERQVVPHAGNVLAEDLFVRRALGQP